MAVRTHQSLSGYVATEPSTDPARDGTPRFYARAGQRQGRRERDGTYTKLPTEYVPIVAYGDAAEEAAALLSKGTGFVAEGRFRPVRDRTDPATITGQEFEMWKGGRRPTAAVPDVPTDQPTRHRDLPVQFTAPRSTRPSPPAPAL